jgi:hypothetical protein
MKNTLTLNISTIASVATVHAIGGIGLGIWLAERIPVSRRRAVGFSLKVSAATLHVPVRRAVMRGRRNVGTALGGAR